jgi:hypothetical protein
MQNTKKSDSPYGTDYLTGSGVEELRPISPGEYDQSRFGASLEGVGLRPPAGTSREENDDAV